MHEDIERACYNCSRFYSDDDDFESCLGICFMDEEFDKYFEDVFDGNISSEFMDLYKKRRYDGNREACSEYEEIEFIEDETDDENQLNDEELDKRYEVYRTQDVDDIAKYLNSEEELKNQAISLLIYLLNFKNKNAFNALLNYYSNLPSADCIETVHQRLNILESFYRFYFVNKDNSLVDMLIDQLYKMPSNNTTRQLFASILKFLSDSQLEPDIIIDKLSWLLENRKFMPKMKQNIVDVIRRHEHKDMEEYDFWSRF